jgi:hypothetical protein
MRPRFSLRIPRPSAATLIAVVALVFAIGGFAVAAIPEKDGTIHGCYKTSGGNLRVVRTAKCPSGEKSLAWNQGVSKVTVRSDEVTITYTCSHVFSTYICTGTASRKASCSAAERATGGGYDLPAVPATDSLTVRASRPGPTSGKPTGWFVKVVGTASGPSPGHAPTHVPIYAVCAA